MGASSSKQPFPPLTVPYDNPPKPLRIRAVDLNTQPKNIAEMHSQVMTVLTELDINNREVSLPWGLIADTV